MNHSIFSILTKQFNFIYYEEKKMPSGAIGVEWKQFQHLIWRQYRE